ncbi:hypothetical protein [Phyllobacterium phragmitis]|uniref:hypothetical protein n=1 Tax=Phyllobacterium phragmitis TaxID=2670329 RepID=UPI0011B22A53|nr:hypothetical protein [Phyllobacterium phragmitis]
MESKQKLPREKRECGIWDHDESFSSASGPGCAVSFREGRKEHHPEGEITVQTDFSGCNLIKFFLKLTGNYEQSGYHKRIGNAAADRVAKINCG